MAPEEITSLREDMRELRDDIRAIHKKLDDQTDRYNSDVRTTELRLQALELVEKTRLPFPSRPCSTMLDHQAWHREQAATSQKWHDRAWDVFVKYLPHVAALAALLFSVTKDKP